MNRRRFLQLLGTFVAAPSVALAEHPLTAFVKWYGSDPVEWVLFDIVEGLTAGKWTFSAATRERGMLFFQVVATGGETRIAVPRWGCSSFGEPILHQGMTISWNSRLPDKALIDLTSGVPTCTEMPLTTHFANRIDLEPTD